MDDGTPFAQEETRARKTVRQMFAGATWIGRCVLALVIFAGALSTPVLLWQVLPAVPCAEPGQHLSWVKDLNGPGCREMLGSKYESWGDMFSSVPGVVAAFVGSVATSLLTNVVQQVLPNFD